MIRLQHPTEYKTIPCRSRAELAELPLPETGTFIVCDTKFMLMYAVCPAAKLRSVFGNCATSIELDDGSYTPSWSDVVYGLVPDGTCVFELSYHNDSMSNEIPIYTKTFEDAKQYLELARQHNNITYASIQTWRDGETPDIVRVLPPITDEERVMWQHASDVVSALNDKAEVNQTLYERHQTLMDQTHYELEGVRKRSKEIDLIVANCEEMLKDRQCIYKCEQEEIEFARRGRLGATAEERKLIDLGIAAAEARLVEYEKEVKDADEQIRNSQLAQQGINALIDELTRKYNSMLSYHETFGEMARDSWSQVVHATAKLHYMPH